MSLKKIISTLAAAALLTGAATAASAITFAGSTDGEFTSENGFPNVSIGNTTNGVDTQLRWGPRGDRSTLTLLDVSFSQTLSAGFNQIEIGRLTWFNESTPSNRVDDQFAAIANLSLTITDPTGAGPFVEPIAFNVTNTNNPQGDLIIASSFADYGLSLPLDLGSAFLTGFVFEEVGAGSISTSGSPTVITWRNPEQGTSNLKILANVQVNAIPLPAAAGLLLSGLGAMGAMAARRKTTA